MLSCCRGRNPEPPRVAYAVGRRAGGAVERNRIRRRLRHVVRDHAARAAPRPSVPGRRLTARRAASSASSPTPGWRSSRRAPDGERVKAHRHAPRGCFDRLLRYQQLTRAARPRCRFYPTCSRVRPRGHRRRTARRAVVARAPPAGSLPSARRVTGSTRCRSAAPRPRTPHTRTASGELTRADPLYKAIGYLLAARTRSCRPTTSAWRSSC